jgi:tetratricopeptide (TPR) repeat protein
MLGIALKSLGQFNQAGRSFLEALELSRPASRLWQMALREYISVSPHMPEATMPDISGVPLTSLDERTLLHLTGFIAASGDREVASKLLSDRKIKDPELRILSAITAASLTAPTVGWKISARKVSGIRPDETSPLTDLLYLARGYHKLQAGKPGAARDAFLAVPPVSPYAPESLFGHAWSLIRQDDIQGAAVRLEELVDLHPDSHAALDGALDLALCYRELGLHDRAGALLDRQVKRLREVRNWLMSLREKDLLGDRGLILLLEQLIDGRQVEPDLLSRTPAFARYWLKEVSSDPYIIQTTALLGGAGIVAGKAGELEQRFQADSALVRKELDWTDDDLARNRTRTSRLEEIRSRLPALKKEMGRSLQSSSLSHFGSESSAILLTKIEALTERLSIMENSVKKAEGFSSLIQNLSDAVTSSLEEGQLNRVRQQAYSGLIASRRNLRYYRESLVRSQGQIWLALKNEAIRLEKRTSLRTTSSRTRTGQVLAETTKTRRLLEERREKLEELASGLKEGRSRLSGAFPARINQLSDRIASMRAKRLLVLASAKGQELREAEALTLYTAADIEISKIESTVQALQEAVW